MTDVPVGEATSGRSKSESKQELVSITFFPLKNSILSCVICALVVLRIVYALPARGSFLTADLIGKIDG